MGRCCLENKLRMRSCCAALQHAHHSEPNSSWLSPEGALIKSVLPSLSSLSETRALKHGVVETRLNCNARGLSARRPPHSLQLAALDDARGDPVTHALAATAIQRQAAAAACRPSPANCPGRAGHHGVQQPVVALLLACGQPGRPGAHRRLGSRRQLPEGWLADAGGVEGQGEGRAVAAASRAALSPLRCAHVCLAACAHHPACATAAPGRIPDPPVAPQIVAAVPLSAAGVGWVRASRAWRRGLRAAFVGDFAPSAAMVAEGAQHGESYVLVNTTDVPFDYYGKAGERGGRRGVGGRAGSEACAHLGGRRLGPARMAAFAPGRASPRPHACGAPGGPPVARAVQLQVQVQVQSARCAALSRRPACKPPACPAYLPRAQRWCRPPHTSTSAAAPTRGCCTATTTRCGTWMPS